MNLLLLEPAALEMDEAAAWYEAQAVGLGRRFLDEVFAAFERIQCYPDAWHPLSAQTRRFRLNRFPYGIVYGREGDDIVVIAVAHLHRRPKYWRDRIKTPQS